jgi:pyruvate/2-oxoglutarate dehydrogenase complex dihydrolipoamide dehydrogenase (E3) component
MADQYDLVIIGAGSGGLTAASFALQLGAKVALVEKQRIGGDCTWTGCVPSKALLKAAKVAHEARGGQKYGVSVEGLRVDMAQVKAYVQRAIAEVYQHESPEQLRAMGLDVILAPARFLDAKTIQAGERRLSTKYALICTGARPQIPTLPGLSDTPYLTYEQIFDNDRLPERLVVIGGGPIGCELAQAYSRLGSQVTIFGSRLLPKEEPEVSETISRVFAREGLRVVASRPASVRREGDDVIVATKDGQEARGDLLLVATGRVPTIEGLDLDKAGVNFSEKGIPVDESLRTNVRHLFACGDVLGGYQFTHFASWQAFYAVRNALLPGGSPGFSDYVPWVTFTDPEVAHVGLTEEEALKKHGAVEVARWEMDRTDRAVCENDLDGFLKVVHKKDGTLLGATMVAGRAGEAITEFVVALKSGLKIGELASAIHAYPTYSTGVAQLSSSVAINSFLTGTSGKVIRGLAKLIR